MTKRFTPQHQYALALLVSVFAIFAATRLLLGAPVEVPGRAGDQLVRSGKVYRTLVAGDELRIVVPQLPTLSIADASAKEGNAGTSALSFVITRAGDLSGPSTVKYATSNKSAGEGDYAPGKGSIAFSAGEASKTVSITLKGDTKVESDETFVVTLNSPTGATLAQAEAAGKIVNDDTVTVAESEPIPAGMAVVLVPSSKTTLTLQSNRIYRSASATPATINADVGVRIPDGTHDVIVEGIRFVGNGDRGAGVYAVARNVKRIKFIEPWFTNFSAGVTWHHPLIGKTVPRSEWSQDITFIQPRMIGMASTVREGGHGGYFDHVDGLTILNPFVDGAGWAKKERLEFAHGFYIQAGCLRVVVLDGLFYRCESVGVQARGSLAKYTDFDDGKDPGPNVSGNVFVDCAIATMLNGPRGRAWNNLTIVSHVHDNPARTGWGGVYASVGMLELGGNVRVSDPVVEKPGPNGIIPAWQNNPRADAIWGRRAECKTNDGGGNIDRLDAKVDIFDLITQARACGDIKSLVAQAQARGREAVK